MDPTQQSKSKMRRRLLRFAARNKIKLIENRDISSSYRIRKIVYRNTLKGLKRKLRKAYKEAESPELAIETLKNKIDQLRQFVGVDYDCKHSKKKLAIRRSWDQYILEFPEKFDEKALAPLLVPKSLPSTFVKEPKSPSWAKYFINKNGQN